MKKKRLISVAVFVMATIGQYYFLSSKTFEIDTLSDIVTFLSILFGFYITSLAIFVTSQYVSSLYNVTDENQKSQTLLHTLTQNYQFGLILTLISLIYFIGVQFFINTTTVSFNDYAVLPLTGLLILNFSYCYFMLKDLINIIIQEGKTRFNKV